MNNVYSPHVLPFKFNSIDVAIERNKIIQSKAEIFNQVTQLPKPTFTTPTAVPKNKITWAAVETMFQRPRSIDPQFIDFDWHRQFRQVYILHLANGFIGDNVIFDKHGYYSFGKWWLGNSWDIYNQTHSIIEADWVISIAAWGGEAFQHFILGAVPKFAAVVDLLEQPAYNHVQIATHLRNCPFAKWFWKKMNFEHRIIQKPINAKEGIVIKANMALYVDFESDLDTFGLYPRNTLLPVQKRLGLLEPDQQDLLIYLGRKGVRSVIHEQQLLAELNDIAIKAGCKLHEFKASGDFDIDLSIMKRARLVMGPHGGAFANILFCQPGTKVVEFLPIYELINHPHTCGRNYWGIAQAAGLEYWTFSPEEFDFDKNEMVIDSVKLIKLIQKLEF